MKKRDQLFTNMHRAALERLRSRTPEQIVRCANVTFDGCFHFTTLGQKISASHPDYTITPSLEQWHILTILHYLAFADGTPCSGKQITFAQYKDGMVRGGGFDRDAEKIIREKIGKLPVPELKKRCLALGAQIISSKADFCAQFNFLPNYPVRLNLWFADEEFPASGRLLLDASAEHYLSIEDAVTVGMLILNSLS